MAQEPKPIRRIVTATDVEGRSHISYDGESPAVRHVSDRPGYRVTNLWRTGGETSDTADDIAKHRGVMPPRNGTIARIIDYPPEPADPETFRRLVEATFRSLYPDLDHIPASAHAAMHRTETVDYAVVLEGELVAVMDREEVVMRAGDVLIQRGTNHGWANRSGAPARILFVLVDAR